MSISALGIGSGFLNSDLIDQLAQAQRKPTQLRLDRREAEADAKLSALGKIQSAVTELRLPARQLSDPSALLSFEGKSSNSAVGVSVDSSEAGRGSFSVEVSQLAQAQALATGTFADRDSTAVGTGDLNFQVGDKIGTLTLDENNNTLDGLAKAINEGDFGVSASILDTGDGFRMVLNADETGEANAISITANGDATLDQFNFNADVKNLTETTAARDANVTINGIDIVRSSNSIDNVVDGVTFIANEVTTSAATVDVVQDIKLPTERVQSLVNAFNALQDLVTEFTSFDAEAGQGSILTGDSAVRNTMNQIRRDLGQIVPGLENANVRSLADVGIATDFETGKLDFDVQAFQDQLKANPDDVAALFANQGRASDSQVDFVRSTVNTQPGEFAINVESLATRGSFTGDPVAAEITLDSSNNTFSLSIDGGTSADITLQEGTFTRDQVLQQIRDQIANNSVIEASGSDVNVSLSADNGFEFVSRKFGSESSVEITQVGTNTPAALGLNPGTGVAGTDVVGTIDGQQAEGDGQVLFLGADQGDASGIQVRIAGTDIGDRGTVRFLEGVGSSVVDRINALQDEGGILASRSDSLRSDLERVAEGRQDLEERINALRERLSTQFAAADALISQFNNTGDFLTQQLASLAPNRNK
ncbi:MAG: flagellar filament capping protein FliD [Oleiphilaceae bacterium]|nr:flagellar filament capping protein FliD [Oleiphilaceae bacterium]